MNKKLIALAVAGASIAPAAMAQTANPVTLYGRAYAMFESVEQNGPTAASTLTRRNRVSDQSSLLGVRGTEDLGGGLKAFFQLETGFKVDQNDTTFAARNSGVGRRAGSALMGRWDTTRRHHGRRPVRRPHAGWHTTVMNGNGVRGVTSTNAFDRRDRTSCSTGRRAKWHRRGLSYSANEGRTATLNPLSQGASISYTGGPVYLAYAYHELKDQAFSTVTPPKQNANEIVGTFTFGPIRLGAAYEKIKRDGFTERKAWLGNIVWTFGNNQLIYQFAKGKYGETSALTQPDCDSNAVGYRQLSRRTFFLAEYVKVDNKTATSTCNPVHPGALGPMRRVERRHSGLRHNLLIVPPVLPNRARRCALFFR